MRIPNATYRLQFHRDFTFQDARTILPYLHDLGISDVYASPIFEAMPKSTHGYDVIHPNRLNPELGSEEDYERLMAEKERLDLGWLQDIVPNHMAYTTRNLFLMDVFERGPNSPYYRFFDIDWIGDGDRDGARVMVPCLGKVLKNAWKNRELRIGIDVRGLGVFYYEHRFPLRLSSYDKILILCEEKASGDREVHPLFLELLEQLNTWKKLPPPGASMDDVQRFKATLYERYTQNPKFKATLDAVLALVSNPAPSPNFPFTLETILEEQFYRLVYWKTVSERINYRRFFYINTLIGLCMENPEVFEETHRFIFEQVEQGRFTGLRIDHIDGLLKPTRYLKDLAARVPDVYLTVEKILERDEPLPPDWPVRGTTGYDFCNAVNGLFCDPDHRDLFTRRYVEQVGGPADYFGLFYEKKMLILKKYMRGETVNLVRLLERIIPPDERGDRPDPPALQKALSAVLAAFPVYRTYADSAERGDYDRQCILAAVDDAARREPAVEPLIQQIGNILMEEPENELEGDDGRASFYFRFEQLSGPLMAKGYEDTLLYIYNRLASLNEVGSALPDFGTDTAGFHRYIQTRAGQQPHTMNATATHDTKRGEDVRARINILSEIPHEWFEKVALWMKINRKLRIRRKNRTIPDPNDEYLIYQTMLGALPFDEREHDAFRQRLKDYMIKVAREAKVHSRWIAPDSLYEETVTKFIDGLFRKRHDFWAVFYPFQQRLAEAGMLNSLAQCLLKLTCPGVADIYQGCELWDLSLVDPDNRRPVDYEQRKQFLEDIKKRESEDPAKLIKHLIETRRSGRIKMYLIYKLLRYRRENPSLFESGDYLPLETNGRFGESVIAFARRHGNQWALTIVPRSGTRPGRPFEPNGWEDTQIVLPEGSPDTWTDLICGGTIRSARDLSASDLFTACPVACLVGTD